MKILHIEQRFHPSYGYQVQQFAKLHSKEHEIVIISSRSFGKLGGVDKQEVFETLDAEFEQRTGARIVRLDTLFEWREKILLKGLSGVIRAEKPDVIFAHGVEGMFLMQLILSGVVKDFPIVTDSHDLPTSARNKLLHLVFRIPLRLITVKTLNKKKSICYYLTNETKKMLTDYGLEEENLRYLPLGVDLDIFHFKEKEAAELRGNLLSGDSDIMILYTGKINYNKDPALIVEAVKMLPHAMREKITIVYVGSVDQGYKDERLLPVIKGERVKLIPPVPFSELAAYYSAADIGVFPCKNTLSSLDAQACQLPLIMQDDPTNKERLKYGGMVYDSSKISDLSACIEKMISDSNLRTQMGVRGESYVCKEFNYQNLVLKLERDMEDLVQAGGG